MQPSSGFTSAAERPSSPGVVPALMASRRSIRAYRDDPVPPALVHDLLELAGRAPSAHNRQPWRWVVVATPEARHALAAAMGEEFARDLRRDGVDGASVEAAVDRSCRRIGGAPLLLLPCLTMEEMDSYPDPERQRHEWQMAVQSVALAAGNLMLAAHAAGLGTCWICAPLFCASTVRRALDLPAAWEPQAIITLGYSAAPGRDRARKSLQEITLYR